MNREEGREEGRRGRANPRFGHLERECHDGGGARMAQEVAMRVGCVRELTQAALDMCCLGGSMSRCLDVVVADEVLVIVVAVSDKQLSVHEVQKTGREFA